MNTTTANKIYDILVVTCGASDTIRDYFVQKQTTERCKEFRFQGDLGVGGKFRRPRGRFWYVDYYQEDKTPMRDAQEDLANIMLQRLWQEISGGGIDD